MMVNIYLSIDHFAVSLIIHNKEFSYYNNQQMLSLRNPSNFRQVIFCSIISERPVIIQELNKYDNPQGIKPQERTFLELIETISSGCKIVYQKGGATLKFSPGLITSNEGVEFDFDCGNQRAIGYYLEYLLLIAFFSKTSLNIHLKGITNDQYDSSVDSINQQILPLLKNQYGFDNELYLKVLSRGYIPNGGGDVHVIIPAIKTLKPVKLMEKGYVKRVRGICSGTRINPALLNKTASKVREVFNEYIADVWIFTDMFKGSADSVSKGYSVSLMAETSTGCVVTADAAHEQGSDPEKLGELAAKRLLDEIQFGGVVSTNYQWFLVNLMACSERKTSEVKLGRVSSYTIGCLRHLKDFLGVIFEIDESQSEGMAVFSVVGVGLQNFARVIR